MSVMSRELPPAPGMTLVPGGAEFAVYAAHATGVTLSLDDGHRERRVELEGPLHGWWCADLPGVGPGTRYTLHADGPVDPGRSLRYDARTPLLDPYARALDFGGSAVVIDPTFDWGGDVPPRHPWSSSVLYEGHVRGLTMLHPGIPSHLRGTYAGLGHPALIEHLHRIGVTTLELLPVHAFVSEPALLQRGLINYWGYNSLGFFAPHGRYAAAADPQGVVDEFKAMVRALHAGGIEVILDVVYNHTAEQGIDGPTLSWRGLDAAAYYRIDAFGRDVDMSGCGNTFDLCHPVACQLVLDSLRYWVGEMHVDGFRFDLAVALGRDKNGDYDPDHPFLVALRTDPLLSTTKLVAEPWDIGFGGWRTGQFPPPFSEWNDRFRDDVRTFWLSDVASVLGGGPGHGSRMLATRLAGSQDLFGHGHRAPTASINFVTAHDGFTAADLTAYDEKHNEANGEGNRDGASHNRSWNHTVEGPTDDEAVNAARRRSIRNLLGTLLISSGVPMLCAGDEFGRTQYGNNNAYCQDNEISWLDWRWEPWQAELVDQVAALTRLRREHAVLRQRRFLTGDPVYEGGPADVSWRAPEGTPLGAQEWEDPATRSFSMLLGSANAAETDILLIVNGQTHPVQMTLPDIPGRQRYRLMWDSAAEEADLSREDERGFGDQVKAAPCSLQVWASVG